MDNTEWIGAYLERLRFSPNGEGVYEIPARVNNSMVTMRFKIYEYSPELGVNIERYIDDTLVDSAYVENEKDFNQLFEL